MQVHGPPREKEDEAGEPPADGGDRLAAEVGKRPPPGAAEHASPQAAGADEDDVHLGTAGEQFVDHAGGAHDLSVAALEAARGIDEEAFSRLEPSGDGVDEVPRSRGSVAALRREVGHLEGADELHQGQQRQEPVGAGVDKRPQRSRQRHVREHGRRIDVGGVVGKYERGAAKGADLLHAVGTDAVPKVEQEAHQSPEDVIDAYFHASGLRV